MATKSKSAGKGNQPPAQVKEVKAQTPPRPAANPHKEEIPKGKAKCQFCTHIQPLKRGDDSISRLQGTCEVTRKIVWMTFFCDKFNLKP
ncbi:MAG: hypothetical protein WC238_04770 [Parcubacteria group bacterium]|jgi:hypothetical protein